MTTDTETKEVNELHAYVETIPEFPDRDSIVEGPVIAIEKSAVYVDLVPFGTGIRK
mgnify:FL=1